MWGRSVLVPAALLLLLPLSALQVEVHYIHWNASNPRFSSPTGEGGEYVVDVDLGDEPWQYHQVGMYASFDQSLIQAQHLESATPTE